MAVRTIATHSSDAELAAALHAVLSVPVNGEVSMLRQQVLDLLVTNADALFGYDDGASDG